MENVELDYQEFEVIYNDNLKDNNLYLVEDNIVGFISMHLKRPLHHNGRTGEILELIIDDSARNCGIGKKLITHVEKIAK